MFEERDEYQCNAALGFPRVALLFQSAGDMPHEPLWRAWLTGVVGLVPLGPDGAQVLPLLPRFARATPWLKPAFGQIPNQKTPALAFQHQVGRRLHGKCMRLAWCGGKPCAADTTRPSML